jgi:demethylmacrocin O-methyltransferase
MSLLEVAKRHTPRPVKRRGLPVAKFFFRNDLNTLALLCDSDKWGSHWYTAHYQHYLHAIRKQPLNLLEIGVGGYEDSSRGGESLRMWKAYLPKARIVGIDIEDKTRFRERRIDIRVCDQTDAQKLRELSDEYGGFDVIIDDGSHRNDHVVQTFKILFPLMRRNGIYAIEDTQTSYWPSYGGGMRRPHTIMAFFKQLTEGLNVDEYPLPNYVPSYFDRHVVEVAFFHNLIVVRKGDNNEGTNAPMLVEREIQARRA